MIFIWNTSRDSLLFSIWDMKLCHCRFLLRNVNCDLWLWRHTLFKQYIFSPRFDFSMLELVWEGSCLIIWKKIMLHDYLFCFKCKIYYIQMTSQMTEVKPARKINPAWGKNVIDVFLIALIILFRSGVGRYGVVIKSLGLHGGEF